MGFTHLLGFDAIGSILAPVRWWGNKKLRFALIGVAIGVLVVVGWLLWLQRPEDLTLRLQLLKTGVEDGKTVVFFHVQGAERYEIFISDLRYIQGDKSPNPVWTEETNSIPPLSFHVMERERDFYAQYPESEQDNAQGWKMQADVCIIADESKFSKLRGVIKDTWRLRKNHSTRSAFSWAKFLWQLHQTDAISEQILTSEPITNTPPSGGFAE